MALNLTIFALLVALIGHVEAETAPRGRYKYWKAIEINNEEQQFTPLLLQMHQRREIEFYSSPHHNPAKVLCSLSSCRNVQRELQEQSASYSILTNDFDVLLSSHKAAAYSVPFDEKYHSYDSIMRKLKEVAAADSRASLTTIGRSQEGRNITLIRIRYGENGQKRPVIFYECGIHAREWISPAACIGVVGKLLTESRPFMDSFDVYVLPVLNPDGYVYSFEFDRFWRKNRARHSGSNSSHCQGVDLNRNFESEYGTTDTSDDPCSEICRGDVPFDQLESQALRDFVLRTHRQRTIVAYFSVHSYGQLFVYPSAYMINGTDDYLGLAHLSQLAVTAIRDKTGAEYTAGNVALVLGLSAGATDDWAFEKAAIRTVFCIELRDTGANNFVLPPVQIKATIEDLWTGTSVVLDALATGATRALEARQSGLLSAAKEPLAAGILLAIAMALFFI